ncbi:hypothetical protein [Streptomyces sp. NPDC046942]|uniref:hypothetical protein n=1 Tax=Streptomyces sp. NPDC046942 TaxID=3155137 RepID=UPI0033C287CD
MDEVLAECDRGGVKPGALSPRFMVQASFTRARQRLGPEVLEMLFRRIGGAVAPDSLGGSFWRGMRLAAVDGFVLDVPDSEANRAFFGGPTGGRKAEAGFPRCGW